jgi:hypothetical protein
MKLLYYLAAIGQGNLEKKKEIFFDNIVKIATKINQKIDVIINMYDNDDDFINKVKSCIFIDKYYFHYKKGVLVELWKSNPYHQIINSYDYVLFILDDVLLENFDINKLIKIKEKYNFDIISPFVKNATHKWLMNRYSTKFNLLFTNAVEFYCYLLTPQIFLRLIDIHELDNRWGWTIDFLYGFFKIKCGIYGDCLVNHYFPQSNNDFLNEATTAYYKKLKKYGFLSMNHLQRYYPPIYKVLNIKEK